MIQYSPHSKQWIMRQLASDQFHRIKKRLQSRSKTIQIKNRRNRK
jgi:hypothetical protein